VYGDDFEEPDRRYPDTNKLEEAIGGAPSTDLDTILEAVIAEKEGV